MKLISINRSTIQEIEELRKIRGLERLSNSEFLKLLIRAFNRRR